MAASLSSPSQLLFLVFGFHDTLGIHVVYVCAIRINRVANLFAFAGLVAKCVALHRNGAGVIPLLVARSPGASLGLLFEVGSGGPSHALGEVGPLHGAAIIERHYFGAGQ